MPDLGGLRGLPLTHLDWRCGSDDLDDAWLAGLATLGLPLAKLHLDSCDMTGKGLNMFHSLTCLSVNDCYAFSAAGLTAVAGLPALREFDLICCEEVTPARFQALRGAVNLERFSLQFSKIVCSSLVERA